MQTTSRRNFLAALAATPAALGSGPAILAGSNRAGMSAIPYLVPVIWVSRDLIRTRAGLDRAGWTEGDWAAEVRRHHPEAKLPHTHGKSK